MTLTEIFDKYRTDKGTIGHGDDKHNYGVIYEKFLEPLRGTAPYVLEVGIFKGDSLRSWRDYFQTKSVYGVDYSKQRLFQEDGITTYYGDQSQPEQIVKLFPSMQFDVVIDDGSHESDHQQMTLDKLLPLVKSGGYYVIEDLHAPYKGHGTRWKSVKFKEHTDTTYDLFKYGLESSKYISTERLQEIVEQIDVVHFDNKLVILRKK